MTISQSTSMWETAATHGDLQSGFPLCTGTRHTCSFMLLRLGFSPWTQVNLLPQHLECWDHRPAPCAGCHTRAVCGDTRRQGQVSGAEVQGGTRRPYALQNQSRAQETRERGKVRSFRKLCLGSVGRAVLAAAPGEGFYLTVTVFFSFSPFNLH